jgi:hypothetical protein
LAPFFFSDDHPISEEPNAQLALFPCVLDKREHFVVAPANNREVHLCLKKLPNIIAKRRNIIQKLLDTMERQLNTMRAGITRRRRTMLIPPKVTPPTPAITLTTQVRLIRRNTAKSNEGQVASKTPSAFSLQRLGRRCAYAGRHEGYA